MSHEHVFVALVFGMALGRSAAVATFMGES